MPPVVVTQLDIDGSAGIIGSESKLWWYRPTTSYPIAVANVHEMPLPSGTAGVSRRPCWGFFNLGTHSRYYGVGFCTANILVDELFRVLRQGIPAPTFIPTIATSGTGVTGTCIGYVRFRDSRGDRVGPLSAPSNTLALSNQGRSWTLLPTTCPDPSVDEIQGLVSMDGALPRVAWTRQLGVTSVTENVATGSLLDSVLSDFTAMPLLGFNQIYNQAQWGFGNQAHPERLFRSDTTELERYEGVYIQTDGEPIVGAWIQNNALFFGSKARIYRATSHTDLDIEREIEKMDLGIIGHFGLCQVRGRTIVPTPEGFKLHSGEWRDISTKRTSEFKKNYKAYRQDFEEAQGHFDQEEKVYTFGPVPHLDFPGLWVDWVLNCQALFPEEGGDGRADWILDVRATKIDTRATFTLPGSSEPSLILGGCGGGAFIGNREDDDSDDNGDAFGKKLLIAPGGVQPDAGGGPEDAQEWHYVWNFMTSEESDWSVEFRAGGEYAFKRLVPDLRDETDASQYVEADGAVAEARTLHSLPLDPLAGSVLHEVIEVNEPIHVIWGGWGGTYSRGVNTRGIVTPGGE